MSNLLNKYNELKNKLNKNVKDDALFMALENILMNIYKIDETLFINYYSATIKLLELDLKNLKENIPINKIVYNNNLELLLYLNEINEIKLIENIDKIKSLGDSFKETHKVLDTLLNNEVEDYVFSNLKLNLKRMNEIVSFILSIRTK